MLQRSANAAALANAASFSQCCAFSQCFKSSVNCCRAQANAPCSAQPMLQPQPMLSAHQCCRALHFGGRHGLPRTTMLGGAAGILAAGSGNAAGALPNYLANGKRGPSQSGWRSAPIPRRSGNAVGGGAPTRRRWPIFGAKSTAVGNAAALRPNPSDCLPKFSVAPNLGSGPALIQRRLQCGGVRPFLERSAQLTVRSKIWRRSAHIPLRLECMAVRPFLERSCPNSKAVGGNEASVRLNSRRSVICGGCISVQTSCAVPNHLIGNIAAVFKQNMSR